MWDGCESFGVRWWIVVGTRMASVYVPGLVPRTCECYVTWQRGINFANGINIANKFTLRWGDYPGLL